MLTIKIGGDEVAIRVVLETDDGGREYFDDYDTFDEALAGLRRIAEKSMTLDDGVERLVALAFVPRQNWGDDEGYGYGLEDDDEEDDEEGVRWFKVEYAIRAGSTGEIVYFGKCRQEADSSSAAIEQTKRHVMDSHPGFDARIDPRVEILHIEEEEDEEDA